MARSRASRAINSGSRGQEKRRHWAAGCDTSALVRRVDPSRGGRNWRSARRVQTACAMLGLRELYVLGPWLPLIGALLAGPGCLDVDKVGRFGDDGCGRGVRFLIDVPSTPPSVDRDALWGRVCVEQECSSGWVLPSATEPGEPTKRGALVLPLERETCGAPERLVSFSLYASSQDAEPFYTDERRQSVPCPTPDCVTGEITFAVPVEAFAR